MQIVGLFAYQLASESITYQCRRVTLKVCCCSRCSFDLAPAGPGSRLPTRFATSAARLSARPGGRGTKGPKETACSRAPLCPRRRQLEAVIGLSHQVRDVSGAVSQPKPRLLPDGSPILQCAPPMSASAGGVGIRREARACAANWILIGRRPPPAWRGTWFWW